MNNYSIRVEEERDYSTVESLVRESFWNVYRPGCTEHYILHYLRNCPDFIPELAFVMEVDGKIIGQNVFVKAQITKDAGFTNEMETLQTAESRAENEVSLDQTYADFFLCKELKTGYLDGITGVYATPKPYFVAEENPEDFEAFDAQFPAKEKLKLPGQLA